MNAKAIMGVGLIGVLMAGCSTTGRKIPQAQVDTIQMGQTKGEVEARIGAPDQVSKSITGNEMWIYSYSRSRPNAKRFIPLLGTFIGGKNVDSQTVTVAFDETGRVADVATAYGGTGAAQGRAGTTSSGNGTSSTTTTTTTTVTPTP